MSRDPNPQKTAAQLSVHAGEVLLRRRAVEAKTGLGCTTIYAWMKTGQFPKSISLGKTVVWPASVIDAWILEHLNGRVPPPLQTVAPSAITRASAAPTPPTNGQAWPGHGETYVGFMRGAPGQPDRHLIMPTDSWVALQTARATTGKRTAIAAAKRADRPNVHAAGLAAIPAIGQPWPGQGGTYAGVIRGAAGQPDRHLIVPTAASASLGRLAWGAYGKDEPGAVSEWDGHANTRALLASKHLHPAAQYCAALQIDGHSDFYLPARREIALCFANVPELFDPAWYWSSTQFSRGHAFVQDFEHGDSSWNDKDDEHRVRACRGFTLQPLTTSAEGGAS